jgi:hypothetical protein
MPRKSLTQLTMNRLLLKLTTTIENFISVVPTSVEPKASKPFPRAREIANAAAAKAAMVSGGLALPPGPLGFATILPDLIAIWRLQAQMVADIAAVFGKSAFLTREQMAYCLFKHAAAQIVRDLVSRVGERYLIKHVPLRTMQKIVEKIAGKTAQRVVGKTLSRWLPLVGALGVGAYAYYDTAQVGKTAIDLFPEELEIEEEG